MPVSLCCLTVNPLSLSGHLPRPIVPLPLHLSGQSTTWCCSDPKPDWSPKQSSGGRTVTFKYHAQRLIVEGLSSWSLPVHFYCWRWAGHHHVSGTRLCWSPMLTYERRSSSTCCQTVASSPDTFCKPVLWKNIVMSSYLSNDRQHWTYKHITICW